ncbi:MAG: SGNH/GDSL hydrolase family protein [Akkermansia sp.]|nr:SGNH/GDSL hydrolase family protein [Akkermansia sp.]MDO4954233.1 SGNH/GDSL hydrolase family protein [Akkermansia sp.]
MGRRSHIVLSALLSAALCAGCWAKTADEILQRNKKLPDYAALHKKLDDYKKSMIWIFVGNSVTQGAMHTYGQRSYEEHMAEIIRWEYKRGVGDRMGDLFINTAESGEETNRFFKKEEWQLGQFKADIVFVYLGNKVNPEKKYQEHLANIVEHIRKHGAIPVLEVPCPSPTQRKACDSVRLVADQQKCLLVDHQAYWQELCGGNGDKPEWKSNVWHPNGTGHLVMAHAIVKELGIELQGSRVLALPIAGMEPGQAGKPHTSPSPKK